MVSVKNTCIIFNEIPTAFQEPYAILRDLSTIRIVENDENLPWSVYVGVLGMPGDGRSTPIVQLVKAERLKVIASAGSDEKVAFLNSIGTDVAFNYKTAGTREVLERAGPINIYWDDVGGETLEATIDFSAQHARVVVCGNISVYTKEPYGVKNLQLLIWREISLHGYIVASVRPKHGEVFFRMMLERVASGEIRYKEHVVRGLENAGQAIFDVQTEKNFGNSVVIVADE